MKTVWIASLAIAASTSALAQSTIYKHVDDSGRVTYTNKPMKGATVMELEPLTTIPGTPAGVLAAKPLADAGTETPTRRGRRRPSRCEERAVAASARPAVAVVTPVSQRTSLAAVEPAAAEDARQRPPQDPRGGARAARSSRSPARAPRSRRSSRTRSSIAAVRAAQQATDPTAVAAGRVPQQHRQGLRPHPRPASHRRRAREEHRGAQERARRAEALASSSLPFRHPRSADAPAFLAGALIAAFSVVQAVIPYAGLELLSTAVLMLDENLHVTYANPAAETLFAHGRKHLIGVAARPALPGNDEFVAAPAPGARRARPASTTTTCCSTSRASPCTCTA